MTEPTPRFQIQENVVLAPYTTFGVGGPARYLVAAETEAEVVEVLAFASSRRLPVFILGGGSNVLASDAGFPGLVLRIALRGLQSSRAEMSGRVRAAAGEDWDSFVRWCVDHDLAGVECMSGIPGTVGATPIQNVGAYGQEVCEVIASIRAFDRRENRMVELGARECSFGYRTSILNTTQKDRYVVLSVGFSLRVGGKSQIGHGDLQRHFAAAAAPPSLREVREAVLGIRKSKGMIIAADDPDSRGVGSFFKNPVVSPQTVLRAEEQARRRGCMSKMESIPHFETKGGWKISAAFLIERAGFQRGHDAGRVGISRKHALALVNRGGATSREVWALVRSIQAGVQSSFGIELVPEAVVLGSERL